jgi:deoxyxylulose-5-phosphate synthase
MPDAYLDHASPANMYAKAGLDEAAIVKTVLAALDHDTSAQAGLRA